VKSDDGVCHRIVAESQQPRLAWVESVSRHRLLSCGHGGMRSTAKSCGGFFAQCGFEPQSDDRQTIATSLRRLRSARKFPQQIWSLEISRPGLGGGISETKPLLKETRCIFLNLPRGNFSPSTPRRYPVLKARCYPCTTTCHRRATSLSQICGISINCVILFYPIIKPLP